MPTDIRQLTKAGEQFYPQTHLAALVGYGTNGNAIDDAPTAESDNIVKSNGVYEKYAQLARESFGENATVVDYYVNTNNGGVSTDSTHLGVIFKVKPGESYVIKDFVRIANNECCAYTNYPTYGKTTTENGYIGNIDVLEMIPFTIDYNTCNYIMFSIYVGDDHELSRIESVESVPSVRDNLAKNNFIPMSYVKQVLNKDINITGDIETNNDGYSVEVFDVAKGDIVKIEGTSNGTAIAAWGIYSDVNLSTPIYIGCKGSLFQPIVYQCPSNGYIAVTSYVGNSGKNKVSWQTMAVSKMVGTKDIVNAYAQLSKKYEDGNEVELEWTDGYYIFYSSGVLTSGELYSYAMVDVSDSSEYDAVRIKSTVNGGSNICRIGYVDKKGEYHNIERGTVSGESIIQLNIRPSEYDMKFLILGTQASYKEMNSVTKLVKVFDKQDDNASGPIIICEGDSLVQWSSPYSISTAITNQLEITTINTATGGENSLCVTARDGAIPMFVTGVNKSSLTIDGSRVEVELWDEFCTQRLAMRTTSSNVSLSKIYIGDISFTLSIEGTVPYDDGSGNEPDFSNVHYYLTPDSVSETVTYNLPVPCVTYAARNFRGYIPLVQFGANDAINLDNYEERAPKIIARHKAIINYHNTDNYFVLGMYPIGLKNLSANKEIQKMYWEEFGYRFIDIRQYLIDYGLEILNITPTEGDLLDISQGVVPRSLRLNKDTHHLTDAAQVVMCNYVVERVKYFMLN